MEIPIRTVLLLSDDWSDTVEGHVAINKALSLSLTGYEGVRVCCSTLRPPSQAGAEKSQVQLVSLTTDRTKDLRQLYASFNDNPQSLWTKAVLGKVPETSFIIGHSPGTAEAAVKLRDSCYPSSKVILFFHVVPDDLEWLSEALPYRLPSDDDLVRLAEKVDVVYSVTKPVHSFFDAKFRNRAQKSIDHRLYTPQCTKAVFDIVPEKDRTFSKSSNGLRVLVLGRGLGAEDWQGLDIAVSALAKVATLLKDRGGPTVSLTVGDVPRHQRELVRTALAALTEGSDLSLDVKTYKDSVEQFRDMARYHLCLVPSRAEPFGYGGLVPISAGIPTIVAEDSYLASLIKRLTIDPSQFLVRTTRDAKAFKQDAGLWKDRILELVDEKAAMAAYDRAQQLKLALKRDEVTIQSHDNVVAYCLRGIQLKVEVAQLDFLHPNDDQHETETRRRLSTFLVSLLRQSWRLKRHSLITTAADLHPLLAGVSLPMEKVIKNVTDKVEDLGRRIVAVDDASGCLFVYCPGRKALRDLWSMSDRINKAMTDVLFKDDKLGVLGRFKLREAQTKLVIPGPEFLKHNEELLLATS